MFTIIFLFVIFESRQTEKIYLHLALDLGSLHITEYIQIFKNPAFSSTFRSGGAIQLSQIKKRSRLKRYRHVPPISLKILHPKSQLCQTEKECTEGKDGFGASEIVPYLAHFS